MTLGEEHLDKLYHLAVNLTLAISEYAHRKTKRKLEMIDTLVFGIQKMVEEMKKEDDK